MEKVKQSGTTLPTDSKERKGIPMARGLLDYFPDALAAVARLSVLGNEKHNPGEPLHWSREKSSDHADCVIRHMVDRGEWDTESYPEPVRHSTEAAWRVLAMLQEEIDAERSYQEPGGALYPLAQDGNVFGPSMRTQHHAAAARDAFFDSAEAEYLTDHGISKLKCWCGKTHEYSADPPVLGDPDCRTHVDPWPYSQKDWKPKVGG